MIRFEGMPTEIAAALRAGVPDANGQVAERHVSDGGGNPCRHCLRDIAHGAGMLVLAYRPFETLQPYAEVGPVFLCADACHAPQDKAAMPEVLTTSPDYLLKGYGADERIVYGTGAILPAGEIETRAAHVLDDARVAFVDVRSARNNCWQVRIRRV